MHPMSLQLPQAPLFGRALGAQTLGVAGAAAAAVGVARWVPATSTFPLQAAFACAAVQMVAFGYLQAHHPFDRFGSANGVTTARAALVAVVAALLGQARADATAWAAALVSVAVTALDGVDGWLARRSGMCSPFGARYDMELDALLILLLSVAAWQFGRAGAWIVLAGAMRYLFVAAGFVWPWMDSALPPSLRRKTVCVVQVTGLCAVVSPLPGAALGTAIAGVTLAALTWSFGVDVFWLWRHRV